MPFCSFADGAAMFDATPIENLFLLEYLPSAPEEFLRVYLYARMLSLHPELGGDPDSLARALRLDEETVLNAFAYWEQQGLVRRLADHPPAYEMLPVRSDGAGLLSPMDRDYYEYRDFNAALQALFGPNLLQPHEYRMANDWLNVLGFEQEAVLKLVAYGIGLSRSKSPKPAGVFKRLDRIAAAWADRGIRTAEDVERAVAFEAGVQQTAQAVLKRLSLRRQPTVDELECVKRWTGEWGFSSEQILDACAETTKSRAPSFAYLDAILKSRLDGDGTYRAELAAVLRELDGPSAQPTPDELERYVRLRAAGFELETVKLAAVQCHRGRRTRFEDLEWMLNKWREQRLFTPEAAGAYVRDLEQRSAKARAVLERCGLERRPTRSDLSLVEAWEAQYAPELVDYAAECARGMQLPMKYMDRLLSEWRAEGVADAAQARARHAANRAGRSASNGGAGKSPANPALNYAQRNYTEADYGDDFYFDVEKAYGDGGDQA